MDETTVAWNLIKIKRQRKAKCGHVMTFAVCRERDSKSLLYLTQYTSKRLSKCQFILPKESVVFS